MYLVPVSWAKARLECRMMSHGLDELGTTEKNAEVAPSPISWHCRVLKGACEQRHQINSCAMNDEH